MKKRIIIIVFAIVSLVFLTGCNNESEVYYDEIITRYIHSGDISPPRTVEQLTNWSTHIVRAEVLDNWTEWRSSVLRYIEPDDERYEHLMKVFTIHRIRVLESFKGDAEVGDIIEFAMWGGRYGNRETMVLERRSDRFPLTSGDEFIFFLDSFERHGFGHWPMGLSSHSHGIHQIPPSSQRIANELSDGIISAFNANPLLEVEDFEMHSLTVNEMYPITLTVGDLMRIAGMKE